MVYDENVHQNMDPRLLDKLLRHGEFVRNLSTDQLEAANYRLRTAKLSPNERVVYSAVQDGFTTLDSLTVATGLDSLDVTKAVGSLVTSGVIPSTSVIPSGDSIVTKEV